MKVGMIGCGGMGVTHYLSMKALSTQMDLEVTAIADSRQEFLDKAAAQFPEARTYATGMELIEKEEVDMIHICLPSYLHACHAVAAMKKGRHVFIEKPVCLTQKDISLLLQTEKETGVKVIVGQVVRYFDEYRFLKEVYDSGRYGKLRSIVMQRVSGDVTWGFEDWFHDEERSGSVVLDLHVHDLDFLRYMLGEPNSFSVRASAFDSGMINQIITTYEFGNVFATAEGVWDISPAIPFEASYRACFDEATVVFSSRKTPAVTVYKKDGTTEVPEFKKEFDVNSDAAGINISNLGPYYVEDKYFAECIRDDQPIVTAPLSDAVKSVQLALQELEAAKEYVASHR